MIFWQNNNRKEPDQLEDRKVRGQYLLEALAIPVYHSLIRLLIGMCACINAICEEIKPIVDKKINNGTEGTQGKR